MTRTNILDAEIFIGDMKRKIRKRFHPIANNILYSYKVKGHLSEKQLDWILASSKAHKLRIPTCLLEQFN